MKEKHNEKIGKTFKVKFGFSEQLKTDSFAIDLANEYSSKYEVYTETKLLTKSTQNTDELVSATVREIILHTETIAHKTERTTKVKIELFYKGKNFEQKVFEVDINEFLESIDETETNNIKTLNNESDITLWICNMFNSPKEFDRCDTVQEFKTKLYVDDNDGRKYIKYGEYQVDYSDDELIKYVQVKHNVEGGRRSSRKRRARKPVRNNTKSRPSIQLSSLLGSNKNKLLEILTPKRIMKNGLTLKTGGRRSRHHKPQHKKKNKATRRRQSRHTRKHSRR